MASTETQIMASTETYIENGIVFFKPEKPRKVSKAARPKKGSVSRTEKSSPVVRLTEPR